MKKRLSKKILAVLTILVLTFSIVACGKNKTIVGSWIETNSTAKDVYVFNKDRTDYFADVLIKDFDTAINVYRNLNNDNSF